MAGDDSCEIASVSSGYGIGSTSGKIERYRKHKISAVKKKGKGSDHGETPEMSKRRELLPSSLAQ